MSEYMGILLFLVMSSLFPSLVWIVINKTEEDISDRIKKYLIKSYAFFFCFYYFVLSAMKLYLGYRKENLFESFWNIQGRTYLHYGVVLLILGIALPIIMHIIFKGKEWNIIRFFDSVMFMVFFFTYFIVRKISNPIYCLSYILAAFLTVFALFYIMKHDFRCALEDNWKLQLKYIVPIILLWIVTVVIYIPNELYLSNASDFPISFWYFFVRILFGGIILLGFTTIGAVLFLTKKQMALFGTSLFAILLIGYLQGMILNGQMTQLDGSVQTWSLSKQVVNLIIWFGLAVIIFAFRIRRKEKAEKLIRLVCIYLVLIQMVSLGILLFTSDGKDTKKDVALTKDGLMEIGKENNIVVFVLDQYDGMIIDEIQQLQPDFLAPLHDFTYYRNMVGDFLPTAMSIPYLLSGSEWSEDILESQWNQKAYEREDALLKCLKSQNYDIQIYTDSQYVSESQKDIISNYKENVKRECRMNDLLNLMMQCSKYRISPFALKNYYQYDTKDIVELSDYDEVYKCSDDLPFYEQLLNEGLYVGGAEEKDGQFKFIHMWGAHPPYNLTEDFQHIDYDWRRDVHIGDKISQAKGALKIVYEYIDQLEKLGKYDDTMIIITADHGYKEWLCDENNEVISTSFPICFIKEPNESSENIRISEAPICHTDILATIYKQIGITVEQPTCKEIQENEERIRDFVYAGTEGTFYKFHIDGNVRDLDSWKFMYEIKIQD